ncbi:STT3 domain-containing protein [Persephonella sp.]
MKIKLLLIGTFWISVLSIINLFFKFRDLENFEGENVLSGYDSYYYARIANDLKNNEHTPIDYLSNVPDFVEYPIPLNSLIASLLSKLTGLDLNLIFLLLPPLTAVLFLIPLYLWLKRFAPLYTFIGAGLFGLFNLIYFERTSLGRFDTDSLILFFVFLIIFFLSLSIEDKKRSYIYIVISGLTFQIFMWWYYKPIFFLFFLSGFIFALIVNREKLEDILKKGLLLIVVLGPHHVYSVSKSFIHYMINHIQKKPGFLPENPMKYIVELQPLSFKQLVYATTDNIGIIILSFIGLILILILKFRNLSIAVPFIIVGLVSFIGGNRFLMYLSPFLGMGLGYLIYLMTSKINNIISNDIGRKVVYLSMIPLIFLFSINPNILQIKSKPMISDSMYDALIEFKDKIPDNQYSYIWSWWDYGNIHQTLLEKGTYIDNGNFHPVKIYFYSYSMALHDEVKSKRLISFITNNYSKDYMNNIETKSDLFKLKDQALKYVKEPNRPVYLVNYMEDVKKPIIFRLGVVNNLNYLGNMRFINVFYQCIEKEDSYNCGRFDLGKQFITINWKDKSYKEKNPYVEVNYVEIGDSGQKFKTNIYKNENLKEGLLLEFIKYKGDVYVLIMDIKMKNSLYHRTFTADNDLKCFDLFLNKFPLFNVYKVKADKNCQ